MRRTPLIIATLTLGLSLTACGGGSGGGGGASDDGAAAAASYAKTPPRQIEADAKAAFKKLASVHLKGRFLKEGGMWTMDVDVTTAGDCQGRISMPGRGSFELRQVDGVSYFKGDDAFWKAAAGAHAEAAQSLIHGRWVTNSSDPNGFGELCDLDNLRKNIDKSDDKDPGKVIGTGSVEGVATVKVGPAKEKSHEMIQVQAEAPHNVVRVDMDKGQYMWFSRFNVPVTVAAPAKSDVFDEAAAG